VKIKIILSIFFVLIILDACGSPSKPDIMINLHIEGVVTYSDTKKPVVNCRIELWKYGTLSGTYFVYRTHSDEDGRYYIKCTIDKKDTLWWTPVLHIDINGKSIHATNISHETIRWTDELQIINIEIN
jgi:hypothetical protein